jgi:beta-phosphoglucomutase-like phosphatase (HAD superfamily)
VTSNDVEKGKPHPDPYLAGAKQCGIDASRCRTLFVLRDHTKRTQHLGLVVEDAPSGLKAGRAAGAKTLAVCTSFSRQEILDSGSNPDYIVQDLSRLVVALRFRRELRVVLQCYSAMDEWDFAS